MTTNNLRLDWEIMATQKCIIFGRLLKTNKRYISPWNPNLLVQYFRASFCIRKGMHAQNTEKKLLPSLTFAVAAATLQSAVLQKISQDRQEIR
jgi:hypothetical protein